MNVQQVVSLAIVGVGAVYLVRYGWTSAVNMFKSKSGGCGSGCSNCAFAQPTKQRPDSGRAVKIIPLTVSAVVRQDAEGTKR